MEDSTTDGKRKDDEGKVVDIHAARRRIEDKFEDLSKELHEGLKQESKNEVFLALEKIQEKAIKWAKFQLAILTSASVAVLSVLGFFGYKTIDQYTDFKVKIAEENNKLQVEINKSQIILEKLRSGDVARQLDALAESNRNRNTINDLINRFKRSQVKLVLHYPVLDPVARPNFISEISTKLHQVNFIIDSTEVLPLSINKPEIILYDPVNMPVADELVNYVKRWYGYKDIKIRLEENNFPSSKNLIVMKLTERKTR